MNKSELIDAIAASADIPKAAAGRALDAVIESVTGALKAGDSVVQRWKFLPLKNQASKPVKR